MADTAPEWEGLVAASVATAGAGDSRDLRALERSCWGLTDAAELLDARLPAPDPEVDRSLRAAMAAYARAGDACRAAARGELDQATAMTTAFDEGDRALADALARVPEVPCPDGSSSVGLEPCP